MKKAMYTAIGAAASLAPAVALGSAFGPTSDAATGLGQAGVSAGLTTSTNLPQLIGNVISIVLGLTGVILVAFLVYYGWLWFTSAGEKDNVEKAQTGLKNTIIGLILVAAAYPIANFVINTVLVEVLS